MVAQHVSTQSAGGGMEQHEASICKAQKSAAGSAPAAAAAAAAGAAFQEPRAVTRCVLPSLRVACTAAEGVALSGFFQLHLAASSCSAVQGPRRQLQAVLHPGIQGTCASGCLGGEQVNSCELIWVFQSGRSKPPPSIMSRASKRCGCLLGSAGEKWSYRKRVLGHTHVAFLEKWSGCAAASAGTLQPPTSLHPSLQPPCQAPSTEPHTTPPPRRPPQVCQRRSDCLHPSQQSLSGGSARLGSSPTSP